MLSPPFKRSSLPLPCCEHDHEDAPVLAAEPAQRTRLAQLDPHLHCSVIGTCLGSAELRKLMARFIDVVGASELDVHHEAVRLASRHAEVGKALHKAMDQRYAATLRRFATANGEEQLSTAWDEARQRGEIPGAYWALLTHRQCTPALRQRAFGEVHMLSHLVGAANHADLRRLVALEQENAELADKLEREQQRRQTLVDERDELSLRLQRQSVELERYQHQQRQAVQPNSDALLGQTLIALHTQRRESAEHAAAQARATADRLQQELDHLRQHSQTLGRELSAAETQLRAANTNTAGDDESTAPDPAQLAGHCILYVGGRPSSMPAIRGLVERQGGEFVHHDGGLESRKGLLAAAVLKADWVVFPVDCIDHDSALNLKRLAERQGIPFSPLRSASVASFAAALQASLDEAKPAAGEGGEMGSAPDAAAGAPRFCLRHG